MGAGESTGRSCIFEKNMPDRFLRRVSCRRVGGGGRDLMEVGDILLWECL